MGVEQSIDLCHQVASLDIRLERAPQKSERAADSSHLGEQQPAGNRHAEVQNREPAETEGVAE